jgi:hypothetical protein
MFWKLNKDFSFYQKLIYSNVKYINNIKIIEILSSSQNYNINININIKIFENLILYDNTYCYSMNSTIYDDKILFEYKKININEFPNILSYEFDEMVNFNIKQNNNNYLINETIKDETRSYEIQIL